ncbi:hypothetical protein EUTSA_v10000645mg [Eutrema salsugineum]|uniref:Uncharacterized protein n=1 Tax=Eutrema salsugineum TaxID=72664 RepID=V4LUV7_EUTSA|nr:hypothetical protein EUTSA_v10000645mg [Eutrema salsugineum]
MEVIITSGGAQSVFVLMAKRNCELPSSSRTIGERELGDSSSVIPTQSKLNSLTVIDQERARKAAIAGTHHLLA